MKNLSLCKETEWACEVTHDHTRLNVLLRRHSGERGWGRLEGRLEVFCREKRTKGRFPLSSVILKIDF